MALAPLTLRDLNRATLARQMLLGRQRVKPLRAIERLAGLQAQWPKPPHVGLWSRILGFERDALLALLRKRQAVRATMMRGTLHVVSAKDYVALRRPLQPMLTRGMVAVLRDRAKGIDVDEVVAIAREHLGSGSRSFEQVRDALASRHPKADLRAMGFIARMSIPLVQVPTDDDTWGFPSSPQFALAEGWLGEAPRPSGTLDDLVLRYVAAFGPATAADVQTWSGAQGVKEVFERLRSKLVVLRDERKRELLDLPEAPRPGADAVAPVAFLPEFDNLVLAHADRRRFVADAHRKRVYLPGLRVAPTFLVDGFVAGTWGVERKKDVARLTVEAFEPLAKRAQSELQGEAEGLARFVEPDARVFEVHFARRRTS
jgi:Winged helix DNA-binding domain